MPESYKRCFQMQHLRHNYHLYKRSIHSLYIAIIHSIGIKIKAFYWTVYSWITCF